MRDHPHHCVPILGGKLFNQLCKYFSIVYLVFFLFFFSGLWGAKLTEQRAMIKEIASKLL